MADNRRGTPAFLLAGCLALGLLSGCAKSPEQPIVAAPAPDWQRPDSYDAPGPAHDPWGPWIAQASRRFDVPERWIREVMRQESGGRPGVTSRAGAMGLMQVMPGTYRELQARHGLGADPYHPWDSIMAGTAYIRQMYDLYGSPAFLAAYNAGPRRLEGHVWGGRGLPTETRNYLARVAPRIQGASPNRRAAPEVYAAAAIPGFPASGPLPSDASAPAPTRLAVRQEPVREPAPVSAPPPAPTVVAMAPIVSPGDPGAPRLVAESLPPIAAAPAPRGFSLVSRAEAGTLPVPPRPVLGQAGGPWGVQVGAFASENLARASATSARERLGLLGTRVAVERVGQGGGTLFRARILGLADRGTAAQACDRLGTRAGCMIVAPGA